MAEKQSRGEVPCPHPAAAGQGKTTHWGSHKSCICLVSRSHEILLRSFIWMSGSLLAAGAQTPAPGSTLCAHQPASSASQRLVPFHSHLVSPYSHPDGLLLTRDSALSARGVVVLMGLSSSLALWYRPSRATATLQLPSQLSREVCWIPCFEVFSGPARAFQLSVSSGTTHLTIKEASLCRQKATASWHGLSNSVNYRMKMHLWTGLAYWCGTEVAWPKQCRDFWEAFHMGTRQHPLEPSPIRTPSLNACLLHRQNVHMFFCFLVIFTQTHSTPTKNTCIWRGTRGFHSIQSHQSREDSQLENVLWRAFIYK